MKKTIPSLMLMNFVQGLFASQFLRSAAGFLEHTVFAAKDV